MIKLFRTFAFIAILAITISSNSFSQVTFSGLMFGDYFYNVSNHDSTLEGKSGFWVRRAYLIADYKLDDKISGRINFEMNSAGDLKKTAADLKLDAADKIRPYIKDAWLKYQTNLSGKDFFVFGIQPTPTFAFVENQWGFRAVEKSIIDLQGLRPARDFGLSYQGEASIVKWNLLYANNQSLSPVLTDIQKDNRRLYLSVQIKPIDDLIVELYTDMDIQRRVLTLAGQTNIASSNYHIMLVYNQKDWRVGALYSALTDTKYSRLASNSDSTSKTNYNMMSVYGAYKINPELELFARYDNLDHINTKNIEYVPISNLSAPSTFIAGLAISLNSSTQIIPNVEYVMYKDKSVKIGGIDTDLKSDLYAKLTFSVKFK